MTNDTIDPEEGSSNQSEVAERADGTAGVGGTIVGRTATTSTAGRNRALGDNINAGDENDKEESGLSLEELIYGASSFYAVVKPVSVTMILTSLCVIYINTDQSKAAGEAALGIYQVYTISDDQSASKSLGLSLVNSLVMVCGIGAMTFLVVLLYKYKCMKLLIGYMVFSSTLLLGFLGGQLFYVAINKYQLPIDQISFYFTMYNFAIVGVIAIFYQKGIPTYINQAYLVATSIVVAWQISYFNEWMAWALLVMLALYDLCAVLTPCGPLKALVKLMSKDDAPSMPGLLYEAQLPSNATRPGRQSRRESNSRPNESRPEEQENTESRNNASININDSAAMVEDTFRETDAGGNAAVNHNAPEVAQENMGANRESKRTTRQNELPEGAASSSISNHAKSKRRVASRSPLLDEPTSPTTTVPLAIAKIYKLPIISTPSLEATISLDTSSPAAYLQQEFSATELQTNVEAKLPRNGGKIECTRSKKGEPRYVVYNKDGEVKRTLVVNEEGAVLEIVQREGEELDPSDNNIKLGLGDFIFYSVLVSKAAENGFAPFASCFISILTGLGGTLVLLAVYHHALPALPISIFLAVIMFVLTHYCMEPWIHDMWRAGPFYV